MKNAKIMLSAIAVVAVVGGALAVKAHSFGTGNIYTKGSGTGCSTLDVTKLATTGVGDGSVTGTTTSTTAACPGTINYISVTD